MRFLILIFGFLLVGCGGSQDVVVTEAQSKALDDLVTQKSFQIESDWAYPLVTNSFSNVANSGLLPPGNNANAINLTGNSNYIKMYGDSISMYLPFYGERRLVGGYNNKDIAIKYDGVAQEIEITKNDKKQAYEIEFLARNRTESFRVFITVSPGLTANISINSSHRTSMRYRGTASKLPQENNNAITIQ